jgi:hypothetical protein
MKKLYTTYITRHPLALSRFATLAANVSASEKFPKPGSSAVHQPNRSANGNPNGLASEGIIPGQSPRSGMSSDMRDYLIQTRALTERHTNAWDLPSLLIKVMHFLILPLRRLF